MHTCAGFASSSAAERRYLGWAGLQSVPEAMPENPGYVNSCEERLEGAQAHLSPADP